MAENEDDIELKESLIWTQRASKLEQLIWKLQRRTISCEHQGWAPLLAEQVVIIWSLMAVSKQQPQHHTRAKQEQRFHFTTEV